jgi:hypothetical protein
VIHPESGLAFPKGTDQQARSALGFALTKAGWPEAVRKNKAPPHRKTFDTDVKQEIARCIKRCMRTTIKQIRWHRPLLVQEFLPGHDPIDLESQFETWKENAYYSAAADREYFFGLFRIDETYNETEAARAFRAWFRKRYGKTQGGRGPDWRARLNALVVMRLWQRFPNDPIKRIEHVATLTTSGFGGCKGYWKERCDAIKARRYVDRRISKAARVEMTTGRENARAFFQTLFPGEEPLSYRASGNGKS